MVTGDVMPGRPCGVTVGDQLSSRECGDAEGGREGLVFLTQRRPSACRAGPGARLWPREDRASLGMSSSQASAVAFPQQTPSSSPGLGDHSSSLISQLLQTHHRQGWDRSPSLRPRVTDPQRQCPGIGRPPPTSKGTGQANLCLEGKGFYRALLSTRGLLLTPQGRVRRENLAGELGREGPGSQPSPL